MAKKAGDGPAKAAEEAHKALLISLLDPAPRPLIGTAARPGYFSTPSRLIKAAAKLCEESGWVERTGETAGSGSQARPLFRTTEAGMRAALAGLGESAVEALRARAEELDRLARALQEAVGPLRAALALPGATPSAPQGAAGAPLTTLVQPLTRERLREALKKQYDGLRPGQKDGKVALPPLFDKAREVVPGLSVERFHDELLALWREQQINLHALDEAHRAERPEVGIYQKNTLYYYLDWKGPS